MWNCESLFYCRCMVCLVSVPWSKDYGCFPPLGTRAELVTSPHAFGSAIQGHKAQYYADNLCFLCSVPRSKSTYLPQQMFILENLEKNDCGIEGNPFWSLACGMRVAPQWEQVGTGHISGFGCQFLWFPKSSGVNVHWEMGSSTGVKDKQRGIVWLFNFVERMGLQEQHCRFSFFPLLVFSSLKPGLLGVVIQQLLLAAAILRVRITGRNIIMCIRKDVVEKKYLSWESLSNGFLISKVTFRSLGWLCCMGKKSWRDTHEYLPFTDWGMQSM